VWGKVPESSVELQASTEGVEEHKDQTYKMGATFYYTPKACWGLIQQCWGHDVTKVTERTLRTHLPGGRGGTGAREKLSPKQ